MALLPAVEIYRYAVMAGFTPDEAVTMTAIALAESGGSTTAHNSSGEDSRGLWQINAAAHPNFRSEDLFDPLTNAKAAYEVSGGGEDVSPWTTTHHLDDAKYLQFRDEAELAARLAGDTAHGMWSGTEGYGHAAGAAGAAVGDVGAALSGDTGALSTFLSSATAQEGDPYVWGAEANVSDADPDSFDCSELIQWAAGRAGVTLGDGTWNQYLDLRQQGMTIPVEEAMSTPGALLFRFSTEPVPGGGRPSSAHVAISLGDGRVIEAAGRRTGVIYGDADNGYTQAALVPGISDGSGGSVRAVATSFALDTDKDGVTDDKELELHLDPNDPDTDGDNLSEGYELLKTKSNPAVADTDFDGQPDSVELSRGTDLLNPDTNRDGIEDGAGRTALDSDDDALSDRMEQVVGTDASNPDVDGDGFVDGAEYQADFDPLDAGSSPLAVGASDTASGLEPDDTTGYVGLEL